MRTRIIYYPDGSKAVIEGAKTTPRESYDSVIGGDKNYHAHFLDCNKKAEAAGELDRMSHKERQHIKNVHTWAQQPGWWPDNPIYKE
jgi:hypothetical protein